MRNGFFHRTDKCSLTCKDRVHDPERLMYLKENPGSAWEKQEQAKLLANPVTVCTIDQLFTFVYRALGTEIFAATLKYSKLIIDEIQSYDPRSIATILYGLKTIQQMGGRYAIITATFPPVLKDFMEQYGLADHCLFADFTEDPDILIRHKVSIQYSEMYLEEIAKQGKTKKVLVICNTVSRAQEVYEKLRERNDSVWLLHSRFIRRDRNLLEQKIMEHCHWQYSIMQSRISWQMFRRTVLCQDRMWAVR